MKRREFLHKTAIMGAMGLVAPAPRLYGATIEGGYEGRLLVQLQMDGAWDVSSYCDPKVNQPGERVITNWSSSNEIQQAGNIPFAPFANNADFFNKYYQDILVINGVDAQTNAHTTGVTYNWSGRNSNGYPTLTAMFAANNAPDQPLAYINYGGFSQTGNLIRFSRLDDVDGLNQLLRPNRNDESSTFRRPEMMATLRAHQEARIARLLDDPTLIPRQVDTMEALEAALANKGSLAEFDNYIPDDILPEEQVNRFQTSSLGRQVQLTVAGFESGLACAADLWLGGFDTHTAHDELHEPLLQNANEALDLLWIQAEEKGFADRLTVVIASDFSRTPHYNANAGKDHWPIGSVMVMEKNASWTNRVIGSTDEGQNARKLNTSSLERDDSGGITVLPKHVHKALRRHLGLENTSVDQNFKFLATEDLAFFD